MTGGIRERLADVRARIAAAAFRAGRDPAEVTLIAVSKRVPAERIREAVDAGQRVFGENYVKEAVAKMRALAAGGALPRDLRWHLIGRLQRNKARDAVRHFDSVETVDRPDLAAELERRAAGQGRAVEVLLQVNLSREPQKAGVSEEALPELLARCAALPHLRVVGLMTLPEPAADPERLRPVFARLRALRDSLRSAPGGGNLRELSMGMSADFEVAVEEGATRVRVGTALFGPRPGPAEEGRP